MSQPPQGYPKPDDEEPVLTLDPEVVQDDDELAQVVDQLIRRDYASRVRLWEINFHHGCLRDAVDPATWRLILKVEELSTARLSDLVVEVARFAFSEGRRFSLHKSE
jgi:hypothetical protein